MTFNCLVFVFLGMVMPAMAINENSTEALEKICPGEADVCIHKVDDCLKQQIPSKKVVHYTELYRNNMETCTEEMGDKGMENFDKRVGCSLQKIRLIVNNQVNRPLLKSIIATSFANSSQALQTALGEAVDTCPEIPNPEFIEDYYICLLKACVDAMDKEKDTV